MNSLRSNHSLRMLSFKRSKSGFPSNFACRRPLMSHPQLFCNKTIYYKKSVIKKSLISCQHVIVGLMFSHETNSIYLMFVICLDSLQEDGAFLVTKTSGFYFYVFPGICFCSFPFDKPKINVNIKV